VDLQDFLTTKELRQGIHREGQKACTCPSASR